MITARAVAVTSNDDENQKNDSLRKSGRTEESSVRNMTEGQEYRSTDAGTPRIGPPATSTPLKGEREIILRFRIFDLVR